MRFVIQRVTRASVKVDGEMIGEIADGLLVLIGVSDSDTPHRERGSIWFGWNAACEVPASIAPHTQAGAAGSARCGHPATELAGIPRSLAVTPRPTTLVSITHQPRLS